MFLGGVWADGVHRWSLSTAWDLSTAGTDDQFWDTSAIGNFLHGVNFKSDGTKIYITHLDGTSKTRQYPLSTPWDLTTIGTIETTFDSTAADTSMQGTCFDKYGRNFYLVGNNSPETLYQYPIDPS